MTMNPRERDLRENNSSSSNNNSSKEQESYQTKLPKITTPSPSSRQWSSTFKNPRIVRVSRNFGGKDRHSKVCTVRGLRDRRIRLSVPTAIQLYDLQDRLGLSQPSKVIDWLIDATENEIDKLPPLPMIPTNLLHYFHHPSNSIIQHEPSSLLSPNLFKEREKWTSIGDEGFGHNFFPINWPYNNNNYFHSDAPILNLSQFGGGFAEQNSNNSTQASSSYMCPSESSSFPLAPPSLESDQFRQMNHLQNSVIMPTTLHLINPPPMKCFSLNASLHSNENEERDNGSS